MSDNRPTASHADLAIAVRIINVFVDNLKASSDLVALLAQLVGEEAVRPLQSDPTWIAYLEAKRKLEAVHDDLHQFVIAASAIIEFENTRAEAQAAASSDTAAEQPDE